MNTLLIHSSRFGFEAKKKTKFAEELSEDLKKRELKNCLVCFMSFEEQDNGKEETVSGEATGEIQKVCEQIGTKTVMLYPFVHLLFGKKPSSVETALKILELTQEKLKKEGFEAERGAFGWYKAFDLSCSGHPLSELSRVVLGEKEEKESQALEAEKKMHSNWAVLDKEGKLHEVKFVGGKIEGFDFSKYEKLEKLARYEMAKSREVKEEPPHVRLMKKLGLADYEPGSDPGHLRYPPKGKMMKALLEELVTQRMLEYGAMEIESPIMYDLAHPTLKSYLERFPARQYIIETPNKRVFLRFAACFGQFLMMHDATLSYKHFPLKLYELTKYSFRVEKRGELTGLRRLRAFTMPDCHSFCLNEEQAKQEYVKRFELAKSMQKEMGLDPKKDLEFAIRVVKGFWDKNKEFVTGLVKKWGKPALVEMWDEQFFYFTIKYEFNYIDNLDKAAALTTDQIDIENGKKYDIKIIDKDGSTKYPLILHLSPSGAIERIIYALLEKAYENQKAGKKPFLPLWLNPTQVRVLIVSGQFLDYGKEVLEELEANGIRADLDDRDESIGKKIMNAEKEWVSLIIVAGEKEKKSKKFQVRVRETGKLEEMNLKKLIELVKNKTKGKPFRPIPMPKLLSKRPKFSA